jgi:hypothetical protein
MEEGGRTKRSTKEGKKMSRDEKVKGIYGAGVQKKGKCEIFLAQGQGSQPVKPDSM